MRELTGKKYNLIQQISLLFGVFIFSLSNLTTFNMILAYLNINTNRTLISLIIYSTLDLLLGIFLICFFKKNRAIEVLKILLFVNLIYIFPHIFGIDIRTISVYIVFILPFTILATLLIYDESSRKLFFLYMFKLRYFVLVLSIGYIAFLTFSNQTENGIATLKEMSYGNVAWFILPFYFVLVILFISNTYVFTKRDQVGVSSFIFIFSITVCYTGLRSGIISIFFSIFVIGIGYLFFDFKNWKKYSIRAVFLILLGLGAVLFSMNITPDGSRAKIIEGNFIYETKYTDYSDNYGDDEIDSDILSDEANSNKVRKKVSNFTIVWDVEKNKKTTIQSLYRRYIVLNDMKQSETEKILQDDVRYDRGQYLIPNEQDRAGAMKYTLSRNRINLWITAYEEFKKRPFFGNGIRSYQRKYVGTYPHNIILEMLADYGIVGFLLLLSVIIYGIVFYVRGNKKEKDKNIFNIFCFSLCYIPSFLFFTSLYMNKYFIFFITIVFAYWMKNRNSRNFKKNM